MIKKLFETDEFAVEDLMVPRISDDEETEPEKYLNWQGLVYIFRKIYPEGSIKTEPIKDDQEEITFRAEVRKNAADENALASVTYKMVYTDDKYNTYQSCQTMALRLALLQAGIGIDISLEEEIKRRNAYNEDERNRIVELQKENVPNDATVNEIFNGLGSSKVIKESDFNLLADKMAEKKESKEPEETKEEMSEIASLVEESKKKEEPSQPPKKKRGRPRKVKVEETVEVSNTEEIPGQIEISETIATEEDIVSVGDYVVSEGDFLDPGYERKFIGKEIKEIGEDILAFLADGSKDSAMSPAFAEKIRRHVKGGEK